MGAGADARLGRQLRGKIVAAHQAPGQIFVRHRHRDGEAPLGPQPTLARPDRPRWWRRRGESSHRRPAQAFTSASLADMADEKSIPLRVAFYARVSTLGKGQDTEVQLRDLREHVSRRGWQLSGEYVDAGISGAKERRP